MRAMGKLAGAVAFMASGGLLASVAPAIVERVVPKGAAATAGAPELRDGGDPEATSLHGGAMWHPWSPGPGELGANPMAFSYDHVLSDGRTAKKAIVAWAQNEDTPTAPLKEGMASAEDNGQVWVPYTGLPSDFSLVASTKLRSGQVLAAGFIPVSSPAPNRLGIRMAGSTDTAKTWTTWLAPLIEDKWKFNWYRVHRDMLELPDGTILLGAYGNGTIGGVTKEYSLIFESTDAGRSFRQRSAVNAGSQFSTNELGFTRTADGRLVALMRGTEPNPRPPAMPLTQTFSDDDGKTWEPVKTFLPPEGMPNNGVMPEPMLQPNGQLLLTYGRPDNNVVVSKDGTGRTWDVGETLYSRHPGEEPLRRWMGSSGNMALVSRDSNSSLAFGDTCHNILFCREYGHDNKIWTKVVDARGPHVGRIDMATKVREGTVKLVGTVAPADVRFPEQRIQGAVDGSGEYRAAARFVKQPALTIELDQVYSLDRIGLMMGKGELNSATVQVSEDGKAWGQPVVKTGARTDWAMRYHDFAPVAAKFVRITPGDDAPLTAITEIELYAADIYTFENDAMTTIPRGLKDTRYALAAEHGIVAGYDHSKSRLALQDNDQTARAEATIPAFRPASSMQIAFGYEGYGYGSGALWDILGTDDSGATKTAEKLHAYADFSRNAMVVETWNGSAWEEIGRKSPAIANRSWMHFTLDVTPVGTTVTLDGAVLGTTKRKLADVSKVTGLNVATGLRPEDVGNMEHSYDDVKFSPTSAG